MEFIEILEDAVLDTIKLIPFLFITYVIMEYIENKMSQKMKEKIEKSGKFGPLVGSMVGIIPQCGFSASATNLYASRIISIGTLFAVYLSTSDEMIPIFVSTSMPVSLMLEILLIKFVLAIAFGFLIDFVYRRLNLNEKNKKIVDLCEEEHCHCHENGIIRASLKHTFNITIYIFLITLIINILIGIVGEDVIAGAIQNNAVLGPILACLIGLIPNCASSVIITNLYIENVINISALIAGLLTGAGVGLIVLFRTNKKHIKENISIVAILYFLGVISGWGIELISKFI